MYECNAMILSVIFAEKLSIRKPQHRLAASASCKKKTAALLADIQVVDLVWYSRQRERFFRTAENTLGVVFVSYMRCFGQKCSKLGGKSHIWSDIISNLENTVSRLA